MSNLDFDIKNKIISYLRHSEYGASASEIGKKINHNRITVGKYLSILEAEKVVTSKRVASAIYWQLAQFSSKPRILIVDDEKHILDLIRLSLTNGRYDMFEAFNGKEALDMVKTISPDLIVLDLMMPEVNGYDVCKELKSNVFTKDIPIIILSAKGEVEDKVELMNLDADDYITKPFDPLELEARVANKLRKKESYHSKNGITGLPSELITNENRSVWNAKSSWYEFQIQLCNFREFTSIFGHKKGCDVLQLFSKMLLTFLENKDDMYIGHISESAFAVFSEKKLNFSDLIQRFLQMRPFLYVEQGDISPNITSLEIFKDDKKLSHTLLCLKVSEVSHD